MDRWKGRGGKSTRTEKKNKEDLTVFFPTVCGYKGSASRLATAAGAEPPGQMRDEQVHAIAARSTCRSQNAQKSDILTHIYLYVCIRIHMKSIHIYRQICIKSNFNLIFPLYLQSSAQGHGGGG